MNQSTHPHRKTTTTTTTTTTMTKKKWFVVQTTFRPRRTLSAPTYLHSLVLVISLLINGWTTPRTDIVEALSTTQKKATKRKRTSRNNAKSESLYVKLQKSYTVEGILDNVATDLPLGEPDPKLPSLTLVRLSKHMIDRTNRLQHDGKEDDDHIDHYDRIDQIRHTVDCLTSADWTTNQHFLEHAVNGIKATAIISRILFTQPKMSQNSTKRKENDEQEHDRLSLWEPLTEKLKQISTAIVGSLEPHHLSGLAWSIDCFDLVHRIGCCDEGDPPFRLQLPAVIQSKYDGLDLPFRIIPGGIQESTNCHTALLSNHLSVQTFIDQVDFEVDTIKTESNQWVAERRQTAWQGDPHVGPFLYSGKAMPRRPWSPAVEYVRDELHKTTGHYYDCCLLNLYPDGGSGMRYHIDPDQGKLWDFETAVISVGATRRFAFRSVNNNQLTAKEGNADNSHAFVVMTGDVTEMVRDCQSRFQHTVKTAEDKNEKAPRVSLVFKKSLITQHAQSQGEV